MLTPYDASPVIPYVSYNRHYFYICYIFYISFHTVYCILHTAYYTQNRTYTRLCIVYLAVEWNVTCIHLCMHTYIHMYIYIYMCIYAYLYVCILIFICVSLKSLWRFRTSFTRYCSLHLVCCSLSTLHYILYITCYVI